MLIAAVTKGTRLKRAESSPQVQMGSVGMSGMSGSQQQAPQKPQCKSFIFPRIKDFKYISTCVPLV